MISIIIPTYNRAHIIGETLDSIITQTYKNWECIVIDDDSNDNTMDILEAYCLKDSRIKYFKRPLDRLKGPNACRNYGFELSNGNYIKWFDSDDILDTEALEIELLNFNNNIDVTICEIKKIHFESNIEIKRSKIIPVKNMIEEYFIGGISFYISGPLWRRSFLEEQNELFDESISNLDDWDFNLRMLYENPNIKFIEQPLVKYRIHIDSLSQEINKLNINEIKSEIRAKEKHIKIIEENGLAKPKVLKNYVKNRYKYFFRQSLLLNESNKLYYLYNLNNYQFKLLDFKGILNSWIGLISYGLLKKGYRFIK